RLRASRWGQYLHVRSASFLVCGISLSDSGRSQRRSASHAVMLRLLATPGFPPSRAGLRAPYGPPLALAPVHPGCSQRRSASRCHAAAATRRGSKPCDYAKTHTALWASLGFWLRSGLSPLLRAPPRFSLPLLQLEDLPLALAQLQLLFGRLL